MVVYLQNELNVVRRLNRNLLS